MRIVQYMGTYGDQFSSAIAAELRAEKGRTKQSYPDLAALTGMAKSTLIKYFNADRDIPTSALMEICRALGIDPRLIVERAQESIEQD